MKEQNATLQQRVAITKPAVEIVQKIKEQYKVDLIFHLSGGCCDGSSPMLLKKEDFYINENDILMGIIADTNFYMNKEQFQYWKHTFLTVDIVEGRGSSFSLEIPLGLRFFIHSRLLTEKELTELNF